jgi:hypothetical protein
MCPLRFVVERTEGRKPLRVDLTALPRPRLAREIAGAFKHQMDQPGEGNSTGPVERRTNSIRHFFEFLDKVEDPVWAVESVSHLEAYHLQRFEDWLRRMFPPKSTTPYVNIAALASVLAHGRDNLKWQVTDSLRARLNYVAEGEKGKSTPVDGWSLAVAAQLRYAARRAIGETIRRRIAGENALKMGRDPRTAGWDNPHNLLWWIDAHGSLTSRGLQQLAGSTCANATRFGPLHSALYLTKRDFVGPLVLLMLETTIPIECLRELHSDCLQNPGGTPNQPTIEIHYTKRRAHSSSLKHERFRDGGSTTPGGIVRWLLRLTERARRHYPSPEIGVHYSFRSPLTTLTDAKSGFWVVTQQWIADHGITGDDGQPLDFGWLALRKTAYNMRYEEYRAPTREVTSGHTSAVAGKHYLPIPRNDEIHASTVEDAQRDAFSVVSRTRVVTSDEVQELRANPEEAARVLGVPAEQVDAMLGDSSDHDVFIAACKDLENSPYGKPGETCPSPWNCFDCKNAVIHPRHLPALLIFLDGILESRDEMPEHEWSDTWGKSHARMIQVFSLFKEGEIAAAREKAQRYRPLVFLPIEMFPQGAP